LELADHKEKKDVCKSCTSGLGKENRLLLADTLTRAQQAVMLWLEGKEEEAMQNFNC
jgi:hypothetical protein